MSGPLEGILVVSFEHAVAAPFATRQLAELGARVIKVERPDGGDFARGYDRAVLGQSSYFVWLNRGKESVALDAKDPEDRHLLARMLDHADVLVQNLAPGAAERLGIDARRVRGSHPRMVHCSISGYGRGGPCDNKKAYDLLIQCESGALMTSGTDRDPAKVGFSVADIATGMYAVNGILAALVRRSTSGGGATLSISMLEAMSEWVSQPAYFSRYSQRPWERTGARHASIAPYGPYRCGDGELVFLGVQNDREWTALCHDLLHRNDLVSDPRFVHNPERVAHQRELTPLIETALAGMDRDAAVDVLEAAGIACAALRAPDEIFEHPQLTARRRWTTVETPAGEIEAMLPPVEADEWTPRMGPVPQFGQHSELIRAEFLHRPRGPLT